MFTIWILEKFSGQLQILADDILVFCGGVIPKKDYQFLYDAGVSEIFGPGSSVIDAAHKVIENTTDHLKRMHNYRKSRIV